MKPTTEDFLIPMADALARVCPLGNPEDRHITAAIALRLRIAIKAKQEHDEECQRLANEWVEANKTEFFQRAAEYRQANPSARRLEFRNGLDKLWNSMRDTADPIFRDYVTQYRPQE